MRRRPSFARGLWTGAVAGVAGSLVMTAFQEVVARSQALAEGEAVDDSKRHEVEAGENTTEKAAREIAEHYSKPISPEAKQKAGRALHYGFGAAMGAVYGVATEYVPLVSLAGGAAFGTVLFLTTDLAALPGLNLAVKPGRTPAVDHVLHWAAHVVYATTLEMTRQGLATLG